MSNSDNSGSGDSNLPQIGEIMERVLTIEEAIQQLKDDIPRVAGTMTVALPPVINIDNDDSGPPGRVMIRGTDQSKDISLASSYKVTFKNNSDYPATLKLPIGPFKTLHEEELQPGAEVKFTLNKKLDTTDPNASFTFDYAIEPTGNGGGPNIIVRP